MRRLLGIWSWELINSLLLVLLVTACCSPSMRAQDTPTAFPVVPDRTISPRISINDLRNAGVMLMYGPLVPLSDGYYARTSEGYQGDLEPTITLTESYALGDLDGDGWADAAIIIEERFGDGGRFVYLAAMMDRDGLPVNSATTLLGYNLEVKAIFIHESQVNVHVETCALVDAQRCPKQTVHFCYRLQGSTLSQTYSAVVSAPITDLGLQSRAAVSSAAATKPSPPEVIRAPGAKLVGKLWYWKATQGAEGLENVYVLDPTGYTVRFEEYGRYHTVARCGVATGDYWTEANGITLVTDGSALRNCQEDSLSERFFRQLGTVVSFSLDAGGLMLHLGPERGQMLFALDDTVMKRQPMRELQLRNATYASGDTAMGWVTLRDGEWKGPSADPGSPVRAAAKLVEPVHFGDLNGDGVDEAVVILAVSRGTDSISYVLELMRNSGGEPVHVGSVVLGNRLVIRSVDLRQEQIVVLMTVHRSEHCLCGRPQPVVRVYETVGSELAQLHEQRIAEVSNDGPEIANTTWVWWQYSGRNHLDDILVQNPTAYRLELAGNSLLLAQSDCTDVQGTYELEGSTLHIDMNVSDLPRCSSASLAETYLGLLAKVESYTLRNGFLILSTRDEPGELRFGRLHSVTGQITAPPGSSLPQNVMLAVRVLDDSWESVGGSRTVKPGEFPLAFEAPFKSSAIDEDRVYWLDVSIYDAAGTLLYVSTVPYPVITRGYVTYHLQVPVQHAG